MSGAGSYLCGVDVGGTFTDAVVLDATGQVTVAKSPSTPDDFSQGFFSALEKAAVGLGLSLETLLQETSLLSHGTTVATNAVVQRQGAKVGLITTAGHGDAILIMRAHGRSAGLSAADTLRFSATDKPQPLVPRSLVREVAERIDKNGEIVVNLDEKGVISAVNELVAEGVECIAVSFLWSFRNPVHEQRVSTLIEATAPDLFVTCSSSLAPQLGEYERTVATVLNCYVGPLTGRYVDRIAAGAAGKGLSAPFLLMQCNGGLTSAPAVARSPLLLLQSGPCGGIVAAQVLGEMLGHADIIATDMGGTTFDVGLVHGGRPLRTTTTTVDQYEFYVPAIDIKSIGAGGGSIAWIDEDRGVLRVGPMSAGAVPGPVCYGRGGNAPTVTDADVVLGYIDPDFFLGGDDVIDRKAALDAMTALGERLGLDAYEVAVGINRIADTHMAHLIRRETIEKGFDPRAFALYSYGGAGPCHAGAYARELGVTQVVVPLTSTASVFSAFGVASSDIVHIYQHDQLMVAPFQATELDAALSALEQKAVDALRAEGFDDESIRLSFTADLRHRLQVHVVEVDLDTTLSADSLAANLQQLFTTRYEALYGIGTAYVDAGIELVTVRCTAVVDVRKSSPRLHLEARSTPLQTTSRDVYWPELGRLQETTVYRADALTPEDMIPGPAIIEPDTTTIVVRPQQTARLDGYGNILIELNARTTI